jgi:hypothetical protein
VNARRCAHHQKINLSNHSTVPSEPVENSGKLGTSQDFRLSVTFWASGLRSCSCRARLTRGRQHGRKRSTGPRPKDGRGFFPSAGLWQMTVRIISIPAVAIAIGPSLAYGSPTCMTQSEARAKFPKATHLYLREHCWSDSAVAPVHSPRHPSHAAAPAPLPRSALAAAPVPSPRPEIVNTSADAKGQCQYSPCE